MRLERLLAIIMYLLNRKKTTAKELSEHFEVSVRTIQRDVDTLSMAGFPVFAWQGRKGGYELLDTFKMDRNFLTNQELETIRTVLSGIETTYSDERIQRLISKFEYMDLNKPSDWANTPASIIDIDLSGWGGHDALNEKIQNLRRAIEHRQVIQFSYANMKGQLSLRSVEPIRLMLKSNSWYLHGYCCSREDYRVFKIGRIADLSILDRVYEQTHHVDVPKMDDNQPFDNRPRTALVLKFSPTTLGRISDFYGLEVIKKDEQGYYIVEVTYPEDEWVYSMILSFGSEVEVVSPKHIRDIIVEKVSHIKKIYI